MLAGGSHPGQGIRRGTRRRAPFVAEALESRTLLSLTFGTLVNFNGTNGKDPMAGGLAVGPGDTLYGVTSYGGVGSGNVFDIAAGSATLHTICTFDNGFITTEAALPVAVAVDAQGDIFGSSTGGGSLDAGTIFEIPAGTTTPKVLASFTGLNGVNPNGEIAVSANGDVFGTDPYDYIVNPGNEVVGGTGNGVVYEVAAGSNTVTNLYTFDVIHGVDPTGGVSLDAQGNVFGTTNEGGTDGGDGGGDGVIFEVPAGSSTLHDVAPFDKEFNGFMPAGPVVFDAKGDMFGTCMYGIGGGPNFSTVVGDGIVWEFPAGGSQITTLAVFNTNGSEGSKPDSNLVIDSSGDLFGITDSGGANNDGTVFEIPAGTQTITTLHSFAGTDGKEPMSLAIDSKGNLFGTTLSGGTNSDGTIFEIGATIPNGAGGGGGTGATSTLKLAAKGTVPAATIAGQKLTIHEAVTATATAAAKGSATASIVLEPTGGGADVTLASSKRSLNLKTGQHAAYNLTSKQIPASVATGAYDVVINITDATGAVSTFDTGKTLIVQTPEIDFFGSIKSATAKVKAQHNGTVFLELKNSGNIMAAGKLTLNIDASSDGQLADARVLTTTTHSIHLAVGKSALLRLNWPAGMSASYILLIEIDPNNSFRDPTTANNAVRGPTINVS